MNIFPLLGVAPLVIMFTRACAWEHTRIKMSVGWWVGHALGMCDIKFVECLTNSNHLLILLNFEYLTHSLNVCHFGICGIFDKYASILWFIVIVSVCFLEVGWLVRFRLDSRNRQCVFFYIIIILSVCCFSHQCALM